MKTVIINCYFGKFPNYFQLWLNSCGFNIQFDFLIFTDNYDIDSFYIPSNVHFIIKTWKELIKEIETKFEFQICINSPYKLTDFKVAYGYIFESYIKQYDYWGYCDIDMIFGDLSKFVLPRLYQEYEKIYRLGHLTLMQNKKKINELFKKSGSAFSYLEVFSNKQFYSFDEHVGLMSISKTHGIKEYYVEEMADISCRLTRLTVSRQNNYKYQVFYYENGHLYRAFINEYGLVHTNEFSYIHLQKRKMIFQMINKNYNKNYYILSNRFLEKEEIGIPSAYTIKKLSEFRNDSFDKYESVLFYIKKIIKFLFVPLKEKKIWIEQKKAEKKFNK